MNPISICRFDGLTKTKPVIYELKSLEELVEFFTLKEPPTVKKDQRSDFFSMAIYKPGATRARKNVEALSGLVLDFDNTEDGQLTLPAFTHQLKQLGLIYLYYTTWSHTALRHRWRLILPFEKALAAPFWCETHRRVLKLLGYPLGIDESASKDVSRMWIMPCKAEGGSYEVGHQTNGKFLDPHTLPPTAKKTFPQVMPSAFHQTTPEDILDALNYIDANCDYNTWLDVGMALQHELGNSGFAIWNAWSARSSEKYNGVRDLNSKWKSFKPGGGVTLATLFMHARNAGWWHRAPKSNPVTYVITNGTSDSANKITDKPLKVNNQIVVEEFEEADEFVDPIEKCLTDLEPFAVVNIFDFPCSVLKSTYDWMQSIAPLPQPIFSVSASISLLAFLKRNAVVSATNLRTNLYIVTIGPSRSGKNNGLNCIHQMLDAIGIRDLVISAFGSAQGLMKQLCEKEGMAYWVQDEMAHVFKNFQNKNAGTHETRLEQKILTLYNCAYQTTDKIKGEKIAAVENPYLNIYGTTTENIIDNLNPEAAISGLLARFLVFWLKPDAEPSSYNANINKAIPQNLLDELRALNEQRGNKTVNFDEPARSWFKTFCKTTQRNQRELCQKSAKVDSLVGNLPEQTIKLALLAATPCRVGIKAGNYTAEYDAPIEITLKDIQWAASVALHCFANNITMAGLLTENKNEKHIHKILEYLASHQGKWVKRANICRYLRYAVNARQLDDLLLPLRESKQIIQTPSLKGGGTLYRLNLTPNKRKIG